MPFAEMVLRSKGLPAQLPAGADGKTPKVRERGPDGKEREVPGVTVNCYAHLRDGGQLSEVAHSRAEMFALGLAPAFDRYFPRVANAGSHPLTLAVITFLSVFAGPSEDQLKEAAKSAGAES